MKTYSSPLLVNSEEERLQVLQSTRLLHSEASEEFDRITRFAAEFFLVPTVLISLVDRDTQWFKSRVGMDACGTDRASAFCSHTIQQAEVLVVEDARTDPRFATNKLVTGAPGIRFYAGAPLILRSGHALGSLCLIDYQPRFFDAKAQEHLQELAQTVVDRIELHRAAHVDAITQLPNRTQLSEDLQDLCELSPGAWRTMALIDVMSHAQSQATVRAVGLGPVETALRQISRQLTSLVDGTSMVYHMGASRFVMLLNGMDRIEHTYAVARLLDELGKPFTTGGVSVELEIECGLVAVELCREGIDDALRKAISALQQATSEGLPLLWYDAKFDAPHRRKYAILRDLPIGLANGDLRLVYQPKYNVKAGKYLGVEALLRWRHPRHGEMAPGEFIPLAETTALIHPVTAWVLDAALQQVQQWQAEGLQLTVAVNVSSRNLEQAGFVASVRDACSRHKVDPQWLHIECTETASLSSATAIDALNNLRSFGIQVSLDDFGTGYSNLSCLRSLPVGMLKIDQSLIKPIATDDRAWLLVQSLISMGHILGYRMLAEGVETANVFDMLVTGGCDAIQGYYLSRPLESGHVSPFVRLAEQRKLRLEVPSSSQRNVGVDQSVAH
ncbi:MAG: GGDEF domain-containing protein [Alcaligenaceae bacterium]|nr:MAG: GGDEF domain-containing protein [Alcaligenaceae bacterium]